MYLPCCVSHEKRKYSLTLDNFSLSSQQLVLNRPFARPGHMVQNFTWYKITNTCEQVALWDFQNKGRCIVLEVPLCNLLTSICNFVLCDRVVQRAYYFLYPCKCVTSISERFWPNFDKINIPPRLAAIVCLNT